MNDILFVFYRKADGCELVQYFHCRVVKENEKNGTWSNIQGLGWNNYISRALASHKLYLASNLCIVYKPIKLPENTPKHKTLSNTSYLYSYPKSPYLYYLISFKLILKCYFSFVKWDYISTSIVNFNLLQIVTSDKIAIENSTRNIEAFSKKINIFTQNIVYK